MYSDRVSQYTVYSDRLVIVQCTVIGELLYSVQ